MQKLQAKDSRKLFEIAWEVCNQVGGIYTVLRSKMPSVSEYFTDNYHAIGPFSEKARAEFEYNDLPDDEVGQTIREMWDEGFDVHYGTWLITGKPKTILFNTAGLAERSGDFRYYLWKDHGVDSGNASPLASDVISFGYAVYTFFKKLAAKKSYFDAPVMLQFHEWMAGVPLPFIRREGMPYKTVFTTHATLLGRYLAFNDPDYYARLPYVDWHKEAVYFNILTEAQLERAAAGSADAFSTVSRVMDPECEYLLGRKPGYITPNGLNINKFSSFYKVEILHQELKSRIHQFIRGHFFGSYSFDLSRTLYFFTSGRYEYKNKGFDLTLEALARLNYKLKMIGSDITVVMFFITNRPVYSINPDVLNARGVMEELRKTTQGLGAQMGEDLFNYLASHARGTDLPDMNDFVNETIRFRIKRTLQSWKTNTLPPVVTHNIVDDYKDDILNFLRSSGLVNKKEDRVKVVYHPAFISPDNPLFGMEYSEFVRGCHLGIFPSYYEPWGYTPCESIASGVPAVTSDLAGFGDYVENFTSGDESRGIKVLHRKNHSFGQAAEDLANYLLRFATSIPRERLLLRSGAEDFSVEFDWKNLIRYYFDIYDHICGVEKGKIK